MRIGAVAVITVLAFVAFVAVDSLIAEGIARMPGSGSAVVGEAVGVGSWRSVPGRWARR